MALMRKTFSAWVDGVRKMNKAELAILVLGTLAGLCLRYFLRGFRSLDFIANTDFWYTRIRDQGFAAMRSGFIQYTPTYPYLLYLVSVVFPGIDNVAAVKIPSVLADFICAWFIYRIVRMKYETGLLPVLAFCAILFAPTIVMNSSLWGQCDSLYTTALVACLYFLILGREKSAFIAFGVALAFKLQAIFLAPLLVILILKKELSWKGLILVPLVYLVAILPAWLAGRSLLDLLTLFATQADWSSSLSFNAPNLYAWLPAGSFSQFYLPGLVLSAILCLAFIFIVYRSRMSMTPPMLILLALTSVLVLPFLLPKMHERYFYPADVLSILFAFYYPGLFFIPLIVVSTSLLSYLPFLFNLEIIPFPILAIFMLVSILIVARRLFSSLNLRKNAPPA